MVSTIDRLHTAAKIPTYDEAEAIAARNRKFDDDGWKYIPKKSLNMWIISVFDEEGNFVGNL